MPRVSSSFVCLFFCVSAALADPTAHVLIVVGPSSHPPGTHEVAAGGRVIEHCLESAGEVGEIAVTVVDSWPAAEQRQAASTVVFIGDLFPPNRFPNPEQNLRDVGQMMQRGCGIVCVHYATGLLGEHVGENGEHPLLGWMGGYFANRSCPHHQSIARVFKQATISPAAAEHPIARGWSEFTLHDEPYINNYFGGPDNKLAENVTPLAVSQLPPESPGREVVAWCTERSDTGRGFAIVMPHFYKNWANNDLRCFLLNGIVWTAKREVPENGVQVELNAAVMERMLKSP